MNIIIYTTFILILVITIIQLIISFSSSYLIYVKKKKNINKFLLKKSDVAKESIGNRVMFAVRCGKVKKQLLPNNSPKYDSKNALKEYIKFINESEIYKKIVSIKESGFYG